MTNEKRFRLIKIDDYVFQIHDINNDVYLVAEQICNLLNEQQDTIIALKRRLEKINGGYGHLTHRNGLTANEWLIESQERELKNKNEQISDWMEQHSKDIEKISEQQAIIQKERGEKINIQEKLSYMIWKYNRLKQKNFDLQVKLSEQKNDKIANKIDEK